MESAKALILLGRFGAARGVRGEIRLQSFTQDPLSIASYGALTDKSGAKSFTLLSVRPQGKDMFVARVEGVTDRAGAEALNGVELYVSREKLPPPEEDEFYLADLIGLRAETREGVLLGHVVAVRNFGAGDILEVAPAPHGPEKLSDFSDEAMRKQAGETLMFPFSKAVVPMVSVGERRVVIAPPAEIGEETDD